MTKTCVHCGDKFKVTGARADLQVACPPPKPCRGARKKQQRIERRARLRLGDIEQNGPKPKAGTLEACDEDTRQLLAVVKKILEEETDEDGTRTISIRGIMYKVISNIFGETVIKSTDDYVKLSRHIKNARKRGDEGFEDDRFHDAKRVLDENSGWSSFESYVEYIREGYECDPWKTQFQFPIILVEKNTVADSIKSLTQKYKVPLFISSGYFSRSFLVSIAHRIERAIDTGKVVRIGYIGDHDPSGWNIEESARKGSNTVNMNHGLVEILHEGYDLPYWERLAVTTEQFEEMSDALKLDVKEAERDDNGQLIKGDTRAESYMELFGTSRGAEVEALSTAELQEVVERFIVQYRDEDSWADALSQEATDRARLANLTIDNQE